MSEESILNRIGWDKSNANVVFARNQNPDSFYL